MTFPALDFRIFGNGHGFGAPYSDQAFYWLSGDFYSFMHGFGAQLHSVQWTHPNAGERRSICGIEFRPFHSRRCWGRVMVAWTTKLPSNLDEANDWLRQFERHLQNPIGSFRHYPAQSQTSSMTLDEEGRQ
jgi:hypothetical protein